MPDVPVSVLDREGQRIEREVTSGTTSADLYGGDREVIAARVNGQLVDLSRPLGAGDVVEPVVVGSRDGRAIVRHSTAHVLAQAVQELFPEARLGIGPPIADGFYYDFGVSRPFGPEDLEQIEKRMREIVKSGQRFARRVISDDDARAELSGEPYKLELIAEKGRTTDDDAANVGKHSALVRSVCSTAAG